MGRVIISGYYGYENTGDEAVLYSIISTLRSINKEVEISVLSNNIKKTSEHYNVDCVNRWSIFDIIKEIKKSDILISGGGSLLQDVTSKKTIPYYLFIILLGKILRKKTFIYAQGIGPVNSNFNRLLIKFILNKVDFITVRDKYSRHELISMGINKDIKSVADPVLSMEVDKDIYYEANEIINNLYKEKKPIVGIYIRKWMLQERFYTMLEEVIKHFYNKGFNILFIPMQYQEDIDIARYMQKRTNIDTAILNYEYPPEYIFAITSSLHYVIGMRLHAVIMAAASGVPYMGLSYDPKVDSFIKSMDVCRGFDVSDFDKDEVMKYLDYQIDNLEYIKAKILERRDVLNKRNMYLYKKLKKINV